jgi:hypothetical protein
MSVPYAFAESYIYMGPRSAMTWEDTTTSGRIKILERRLLSQEAHTCFGRLEVEET